MGVKEWINLQDRYVSPVRSVWRDVFWGRRLCPVQCCWHSSMMMVTSTVRLKLTIALSHTLAVLGRLET